MKYLISFLAVFLISFSSYAASKEGSCEDQTEFAYYVSQAKLHGMQKDVYKKRLHERADGVVDQKSLDKMLFIVDVVWSQEYFNPEEFFVNCQKAEVF